MSQQIQISGGAKVRDLQDVIIGTSGVLSSLAFDVANGVPRLDVNGKILVSQLPNSVMEYKGTWDASTNTPTLANGTGNQGDVYLCNVAGTVDFGAGPIAFFVGDQVIYSGSIWQRASGATGTVTSVAITESGDSLNITGSPITTSGTINIGFNGTNLQYVNGAGNLTTFPILTGYVPYTGATQNVDLGVYDLTADLITGATGSFASSGGSDTFAINHSSGSGIALNITKGGNGEGLYINKTSGSGNAATIVGTLEATTLVKSGGTSSQFLKADGTVDSSTYALDSLVVHLAGTETITGSKTFSANPSINTGGQSSLSILSSTGNSALIFGYVNNILKGTIDISATEFKFASAINSTFKFQASGLGIASLIFHNTTNYTYTFPSATGTIALTSDLTGGTVTSVAALTIGTTGTDLSSSVANSTTTPVITLNVPTASATNRGALSSADWTTFNNKQSALTNPVTGTGTTNYLPKFTGTSTIGNSLVYDNGTNVGINTITPDGKLDIAQAMTNGSTSAFTTPHLSLTATSTTDNTGFVGMTFATSDNANYGYSYGALRSSGGLGDLIWKQHFNSAQGTELMRLTYSGNLGIGTTIPVCKLHVNSSSVGLLANISDGIAETLQISTGSGYVSFLNPNSGVIAFRDSTNSTERMRITSDGNVGIGTSSPNIGGYGANGRILTIQGVSGSYGVLELTSNSANADGSAIGRLDFGSDGQAANYKAISSISSFLTGSTSTKFGADLRFYTRADNAASGDPSERMRITSGGNVLIGTTTDGGYKLLVEGTSGAFFSYAASSTYFRIRPGAANSTVNLQFGASGGAAPALIFSNDANVEKMRIADSGAVTIVGSLSKGSGSFRIEHPLKSMSETHQLVHSFVEAPQADLYYRGKLILVNGKGQANIDEIATMTEGTFEALCREVQCFTTNESGWDLVKGKVIGNIIYIESQNAKSTDEISWLVIGERKDKHIMETDWTDENGKVIVEPLKQIKEEIEEQIIQEEIIENINE